MILGPFDHLLCVIEQEHAEQDQATVDTDGVEARTQGCSGRQEHASCSRESYHKTWELISNEEWIALQRCNRQFFYHQKFQLFIQLADHIRNIL